MIVIGLSGQREAGKDTATFGIACRFNTKIMKFSAPIKRMLLAVGVDFYGLEGDGKTKPCAELYGAEPVVVMQALGDLFRKIDDHFFVKKAEEELVNYRDYGNIATNVIVYPDVRLINEIEMLKRHGGKIIHVVRPNNNPMFGDNHLENRVLPFDFEVVNDGTKEDLHLKCISIVEGLLS